MEYTQVEKSIIKKYGDGVIISGADIVDADQKIVSVSPSLDIALNGGIPEGCFFMISGLPKTGKTTTALQFAANCQSLGKKVFYADVEHRLKKMNLKGIHGLDADKIKVIHSTVDKQYSAEEFLNIVTDLLRDKDNEGSLFIIDSASALCAATEYVDAVSGQTRSLGPRIMSNFCRKNASVVPVMKSIVLVIQHLISNTSGYGPAVMEDGGVKIQYQLDVKIRVKGNAAKWIEDDKRVGQIIKWDVLSSALGPPGSDVESYLRYGYGIDDITETINIASDLGVITKGGSWFTLGDGTKIQGTEKLYKLLLDNTDKLKEIKEQVRNMLT